MDKKIEEVLNLWHTHFEDEENQYSEYERSDVDYFVGCMLYNHFAFSKALDTMKTMDLSYDFLEAIGSTYEKVLHIIQDIVLEDEIEKLEFLQNYISEVKLNYSADALYLLNRLEYHIESMAQRYHQDITVQKVDFEKLAAGKSGNPLLR